MSVYKVSDEFEKAINFIGDKKRVAYLKNNRYNDFENCPAIEIQYSNGNKKVLHYTDNKLHRLDGPAVILYGPAGEELEKKYYIDDQRFKDEPSYLTAVSLYKAGNSVTQDVLEDLDPEGKSEYDKLISESFDFSDAPIGTNLDNEEDANSLFDSLGI